MLDSCWNDYQLFDEMPSTFFFFVAILFVYVKWNEILYINCNVTVYKEIWFQQVQSNFRWWKETIEIVH